MYTFVCHLCRDMWQETALQHKVGTLSLRERMITRQMSWRCPCPLAQHNSRYLWGWPVVHEQPFFLWNEVSYDRYRFIYEAFPNHPILAWRTKSSKKSAQWHVGSTAAWMMNDNHTCSRCWCDWQRAISVNWNCTGKFVYTEVHSLRASNHEWLFHSRKHEKCFLSHHNMFVFQIVLTIYSISYLQLCSNFVYPVSCHILKNLKMPMFPTFYWTPGLRVRTAVHSQVKPWELGRLGPFPCFVGKVIWKKLCRTLLATKNDQNKSYIENIYPIILISSQ